MAPTHSNALAHALAPRCSVCGLRLLPGAGGWRSEGRVVSEPWGYDVQPTRFWCPECLGTVPRDEPRVHC